MDRSHLDRLTTANTERILRDLTQQQHLHPTRSAADTARLVCEDQGYPRLTGDQALRQLAIDVHTRVGRLSRDQVRSLAGRIESVWQAELTKLIHAQTL